MQEAFVIGFRRISEGTYEERGRALLAFLYGVAHNLLRSTARRQQRESGDEACLAYTPTSALPVEQQVMLGQVLAMVRDSHARLPAAHRNIIDGLYGQGKASHELGAELDKTAVNVRAIAHRATKSISQQIADEYELELSTQAVRTCIEMM